MKPTFRMGIVVSWLWIVTALLPALAFAAAPEFTASQKFAFDKTVAAADNSLASKLTQQYTEYIEWKRQSTEWEQKTGALHYGNEDRVITLRKRIKLIDAGKIEQLTRQLDQAKKRYQPLFDLYKTVNYDLAVARKLKSGTAVTLLRTQADGMKLPVQLARQDIKVKYDSLQSAKSAAAASMKKVRDTLSGIEPVQVQIRAVKAALSSPKDSRYTVWKSLTQAVAKREAKTASDLLGSANTLSRQLLDQQKKIYALETKIADLIQKATAQIPASV